MLIINQQLSGPDEQPRKGNGRKGKGKTWAKAKKERLGGYLETSRDSHSSFFSPVLSTSTAS